MMPIQHRRMGVTLLLLRLIKTVQLDNFTIYSIEYECYTSLCWRAQIHFLEAHLEQEQQFSNFDTIEDVQRAMFAQSYIADRSLATAVFLALKRRKPLLLEGEPGVGKTEIAKVLAAALDTQLIRLQCYEGIDVSTAVYEWNYTRQMLHIRLMETEGITRQQELKQIFGPALLVFLDRFSYVGERILDCSGAYARSTGAPGQTGVRLCARTAQRRPV